MFQSSERILFSNCSENTRETETEKKTERQRYLRVDFFNFFYISLNETKSSRVLYKYCANASMVTQPFAKQMVADHIGLCPLYVRNYMGQYTLIRRYINKLLIR